MNEKLKVTYLTLNPPNSGSIIATLGMYLPKIDLYLSKMRLVRKKNGGLYLAYPAEEFINQRSGNKECNGIKVTYLTLNPPNSGSIIATLGMYLPKIDLYLSKMRLVRKKNGGLYLAYPSDTGILPIQDPTNGQPYEVRKGD